MTQLRKFLICLPALYLCRVGATFAQSGKKELLPFGDMNKWMVREIKESKVIGGETKFLYEVSPEDTLFNNTPYKNKKSPWGTSNVLARVKGVTKTSLTAFPEQRDNGFCARLETRIEECKVIGLFYIRVLASGTLFLGEMVEPITNTNNPHSKLVAGIPFTGKPVALEYDYKVIAGGKSIRATGFSKQAQLDEIDMAETHLLLQHRWEDEEGNVFAKRVGTAWERFDKTNKTWQNGHQLQINYGDISKKDYFRPYMDLESINHTRNSKGKMVPIQEIGWADENEPVTHIILQFSSSNGGAYIGNIESRFWIDNVKLVY